MRLPFRRLLALALLCAAPAWAAQVALQGMMGNRALLIVDGSPPKPVAPGETFKGVKLVSTSGDQAVVEVGGQRHTLRIGESQASVGGSILPQGTKIVLTAGSGGHFMSEGALNGKAAYFMVDTGATTVALGASEADRLGIEYRQSGQPVRMSTANGIAMGWRITLASVRVRDVEVLGVEAIVSQGSMPYVLLGNSFLSRFQMRRENDLMVLERRF